MALAGGALLHRRPLTGIALLLGACAAVAAALDTARIPFLQFLAVDVALYFVAATRPRRTGVAAAAMSLSVMAGCAATQLLLARPSLDSTEPAVALTAVALLIAFGEIAAAVINESSTPRGRCYLRCDHKYIGSGPTNWSAYWRCQGNCARVYATPTRR